MRRLMAVGHWPLAWVYQRTLFSFTAEKGSAFAGACASAKASATRGQLTEEKGDNAEEKGYWPLAIG